ncbi:MAG: ATP-grasp domain-containing protein [Patescibacteria group bacterium]|nr:ATP-grasp domain-containing protein [Patescibacteria group bacterium]
MRILVVSGGNSSERNISLTSAKNVSKALKNLGYKTKTYDLKQGYEPLKKIAGSFDVLFPVLHGEEGEGGKLHKFLSKLGKPIVGTRNFKGMQKGWYKIPFKKFCDRNEILTPKWKAINSEKDVLNFTLNRPKGCVLKSSSGGSSLEVFIITSKKDLKKKACQKILHLKAPLFVEEYLLGIEATVGILNNKALPVMEIVPPKGEWFSYKNKYGLSKEIPNAPDLDEKMKKKLQDIALKIHKHFELGSYSRIDFIVYKNRPYVLELNTIPGLTEESLFPKIAKSTGIKSFEEFIKILVENAA